MTDFALNLPQNTAPAEEGEDFAKYLRSLLNHYWIILTFVGVGLTLAVFHFYRLPDYFSATAKMLVYRIDDTAMTPYKEMAVAPQFWDTTYYDTQLQIIGGFPVAKTVAEKLELAKRYGVGSSAEAANIIRGSIHTTLVRNTRIIVITVTDSDPEWAAKIANAVVESYTKESLRDRLFVSEQILQWFPEEIRNSKDIDPTHLLTIINDDQFVQKLPLVANDPLVKKLKDEKMANEGSIRELLTRYTPEHPQIKELNTRIMFLDSEMRLQIAKLTGTLKTTLEGEFSLSNIKILEKASPPSGPSGPNRKRGIITWIIVSFMMGAGLAVFLDTIDKTVKSDEDILGIPGLPFLGNVPIMSNPKKKATQSILEQFISDSALADAITSLHTALMFSMPKGQNKLIMVTSSVPGEGKTTVSYLLAASMAKLGGKVLFVELDLRKPSISQKMHTSGQGRMKGITDYLVGQATMDEILLKSDVLPNLSVIESGGESPNPTTLFTSQAFDDFLKYAESTYDRVVFDTPPSFHIPDPIILSNKLHGVIFVVGAGMVHRKILKKTVMKFNFVRSALFGAVINRVNFKKTGYGHYGGYYGKYGNKK